MKKTVMKLALASLLAVAAAAPTSANIPNDKNCPGFVGWDNWVVYYLLPASLLPGNWISDNCR